jgi:hypothetical protein
MYDAIKTLLSCCGIIIVYYWGRNNISTHQTTFVLRAIQGFGFMDNGCEKFAMSIFIGSLKKP